MKTYILYTTSRPATYQKRADAVAAEWSKTKGRGRVEVVVTRVRPVKPKVAVDADGDRTIDWAWFREQYPNTHDGVVFHFTPYYRKRWGMTESVNGSRNQDNRDYPEYWICCDADAMAKGYTDLGEFERLMYHEHAHFDEDQDDTVGNVLTQDSVHTVDYKMKQIQVYHLLVDYRGKAFKETVNKAIIEVIKFAKKYI